MQLIDNIPVWGPPDAGAVSQINTCLRSPGAVQAALMGDHHKGYAQPVGGVVAYHDAISVSGVGYDIGCGNLAVRTDASAADVRANIATIMDDVWRIISFGIGRKNDERVEHALFDADAWKLDAVAPLKEMARGQLGTVGSGNHYVDIFTDEQDRVWVGVHFGSRGLGHKTATHFLNAAGAKDGMDVEPCVLEARSGLGQDYLQCMELAGKYAYAGREWVCARVLKLLGATEQEFVHNHHNYAWLEDHGDGPVWVVRKGATPAFPGQRGFVGGTMGEKSVILEGVENEHGRLSMYSTIHGAGRVMGRMEAKGKVNKAGVVTREPKVTQAMMDEWVSAAGVELRGAGVDESPHCYKRLDEVLVEHDGMVKVLHELTPIGVAMAGREYDPYRD